MFRNYIKIAFRSLSRNKTFSMINILGLVIGISFSCMLYIYVSNELSYDSFHTKSDRIFRVITIDKRVAESPRQYAVTVSPLGKALLNDYPEVTDVVRLHQFTGQVVFEINGQNFQERNWFTADPNFFDVFDFEFVAGNKTTALKESFSVVLTETTAKKYFGRENPVGEIIENTSFGAIKVTGVIKDHPDNSHLQFDMMFSNVRTDDQWKNYLNDWQGYGAYTYVVLDDKSSIQSLRGKMAGFRKKYFAAQSDELGVDFQNIEDIYLGSRHIEGGAASGLGQISYVYIFMSMGAFLLIIACINYINLATAKALVRSREVGIRKTVGAFKNQLVVQFLTESFVITLISMALAIGLMDLAFPYFNSITGKDFEISEDTVTAYLPPLLIITLLIGFISGSYPAFYLARLKPAESLKGNDTGGKGTISLRKSLVVFQFVLTIVMMVSMLVVGKQLNFIATKDIGFDKDHLMVIDINSGSVRQQFQTIKHEYSKISGVTHVAVSSRVPGEWKNIKELYVSRNDAAGGTDSVQSYFMGFDEHMLETYDFKLLSGNYFPAHSRPDSTKILLNESAVKAFGLTDPIGANVRIKTGHGEMSTTVIGVLKDFNFQSLHQKIAPIIIGTWNSPFQYIDYFTLRISGDIEKVTREATRVHEMFDERTPIEYHFLDQQLQSFYVAEQRAGKIFRMASMLSVFVASLGLFGLASYNIQRRTKELGIRKVLGASASNLFLLLSSSFSKQVAIAFLIASPIAYYMMFEWLKAFEYKISLHAGIFLLAGVMALMVALATVSYRILRAAHANPINALRQE